MDNPETEEALGIRQRTKTNKEQEMCAS